MESSHTDLATPYESCLVMGGGGFRFGYYLGIYAALKNAGRPPGVLLATCGGAIAAGIIKSYSDDQSRKEWLQSRDMYEFWRGISATRKARLPIVLLDVAKRLAVRTPRRLPDLWNDYLFDIPNEMPLPPAGQRANDVDVAILAGKVRYMPTEARQLAAGEQWFSQVVFCGRRVQTLLDGLQAPASSNAWGKSTVCSKLLTDGDMPLEHAVRASVSDMYLFRCHEYQGASYTGGIIDLMPVEIGNRIARRMVIETKSPYDRFLATPALRTVFGFDGNSRLEYVRRQPAALRIDTVDVETALKVHQIQRVIDWRTRSIEMLVPNDYAAYVKGIEAQWNWGYERCMASLSGEHIAKSEGSPFHHLVQKSGV